MSPLKTKADVSVFPGQSPGLAGLVVFGLFALLHRIRGRNERRWILAVSLLAAVVALLGALGFAYRQLDRPDSNPRSPEAATSPHAAQQPDRGVSQLSIGDNSPNLQGITGGIQLIYRTPGAADTYSPTSVDQP